ncbi:MAG TPA: hypothetical protein VEA99_08315 [Gemmatimonadaceae bacterium]|nr:hypothetical protein [Gemmatimonadaceae bacterium]
MAEERRFQRLLAEFRRAGIDPNTFSAMLAVNPEDALRALEALPDQAGPAAFLAELRRLGVQGPPSRESRPIARVNDGEDRASGAA